MKSEAGTHARLVSRGTVAGTAYSVFGSPAASGAEAIVLIHGVGMNQSVWTPQIDALSGRFQVIVYDMPGHGGSALPSPAPTLGEYAAQLASLLDALQIGHAHVIGHSMGALVALEFALTHPGRTLSVVALNAVYDRTPAQRDAVMTRAAMLGDAASVAGVETTLARWFGDPVPAHLVDAAQSVHVLLKNVDPAGYARTYRLFARSDRAHVGRLESLAVPALFLTGEHDPNSSPAMSRAMAEASPMGRAEVLDGARHMMSITDPGRVNAWLLHFLGEASAHAA